MLAALLVASAAAPVAAQPAPASSASLASIDPERLSLAGQFIDAAYPPEVRREIFSAVEPVIAELR